MANEINLTQFLPGQSGNPKGRPKGSLNFRTIAKNILDQDVPASLLKELKAKGCKDKTFFKAMVWAQAMKAIEGDTQSFRVLTEFVFGKLNHLGNEDLNEPIKIVIERADEC